MAAAQDSGVGGGEDLVMAGGQVCGDRSNRVLQSCDVTSLRLKRITLTAVLKTFLEEGGLGWGR